MKKIVLSLITIAFLLNATSIFARDQWVMCGGCSETQEKSEARGFALDVSGTVLVHALNYSLDSVKTYQVVSIIEDEPGFSMTRIIVTKLTTTDEIEQIKVAAFDMLKANDEWRIIADNIDIDYDSAGHLANEIYARNVSNVISRELENQLDVALLINGEQKAMDAFLTSVSKLKVTIVFPDGSEAILKLSEILHEILDLTKISFTFKIGELLDPEGKSLPLTADELVGYSMSGQNNQASAWSSALTALGVQYTWPSGGTTWTMNCYRQASKLVCELSRN